MSIKNIRPHARYLDGIILAAALGAFLLVIIGGVVRVTGSGGACLDWPACMGKFSPPPNQSAMIDYFHRLAALIVALLVFLAALGAWLWRRGDSMARLPLIGAALLVALQVLLGRTMTNISPDQARNLISAFHLGISLVVLGLLVFSAVMAYQDRFVREESGSSPRSQRLMYRAPFARLLLITLVLVFLLLLSGTVVAGSGSRLACSSWPLCSSLSIPESLAEWINLVHRLMVGIASGAMVVLFWRAWRTQRRNPVVLVSVTATVVLFFSQALLGSRLVEGFPPYLLGLHQATAVATWATLIVAVTAAGLTRQTAESEREEFAFSARRKGVQKDFLMLTKPIVVVLLLVTTFAGMVIGAQAWPSMKLVFWTLLGGFLAAGGSGAINQYIDRSDDQKMQRTEKRPIPAGRLTPGEGLAFGVALCLVAFFLMTAFVNFLAAMLSLAGMIYYVLIYSIFLKKATVQNIVIGGGAGAIPPLVGWAAATGSLNVPSLFLFALVFLWTPPHFWALALVRKNDYARAGVPMLPVVRGEGYTRWQIFIYTLELVGLTLVLPLIGLGGSIYLLGAILLGIWLLYAAWKVWRKGGNKLAWKMYRYSSMYLAFIFIVLMIDRLL